MSWESPELAGCFSEVPAAFFSLPVAAVLVILMNFIPQPPHTRQVSFVSSREGVVKEGRSLLQHQIFMDHGSWMKGSQIMDCT